MMMFLLKFLKSEWIESYLEGKIYFNPAYKYCLSDNYSSGQYDPLDSYVHRHASHLCMAPIIGENSSGIVYGKGIVVSEKADVHIQSTRVAHVPVTCFRIVDSREIKKGVYKIGSSTLGRIRRGFPDYDAFVLICFPKEFIQQIGSVYHVYGNQIFYGYSNPKLCGLSLSNDPKQNTAEFCLQMYNKLERFKYQKEYRVVLPDEQWDAGKTIDIGSIQSITLAGDIDMLGNGLKIEGFIKDGFQYYKITPAEPQKALE